jgi:chromosome segregation ATPase
LEFVVQELLYNNRRSSDPKDHPNTGHVSLVFERSDGSVIRFKRSILMSGQHKGTSTYTSRYELDQEVVSMDAFMQKLLSVGINTRARNFLVFQVCGRSAEAHDAVLKTRAQDPQFASRLLNNYNRVLSAQGDIEKVAQMTPLELTKFFELISGSDALEPEYTKQQEEMLETEKRLDVLHAKSKGILSRKKRMKEAKDEAERYQRKKHERVCLGLHSIFQTKFMPQCMPFSMHLEHGVAQASFTFLCAI